jgi:pimeloyl-ACP methyl ester carboxylesterase
MYGSASCETDGNKSRNELSSHWWSYIAPYFTRDFRVAAIDLSGMGDSGRRASYNSELRAAAQLGERPFVIGHSFGGFMTMKVASQYGDML